MTKATGPAGGEQQGGAAARREALTCHPAVQNLCRAPDQALVVVCNGALRHAPVDVVELRAAARVLQGRHQHSLTAAPLLIDPTSGDIR